MTRAASVRHNLEGSRTFALSTLVNFFLRVRARSAANRTIRETSSTEYFITWYASVSVVPESPKYNPPVSSRTKRMSTPLTASGRNGEISASSGYTRIGRRLANSSSSRRRSRSPRSGRVAAPSQAGPPTAPSKTASAARHASRVSSGSGDPVWSMAAPPIRQSTKTNS